jgi:hypothetical protein
MAWLTAADLSYAGLEGAVLVNAQLSGTLLVDALFYGASLHRASLVGASARGAKFHGALLVESELQAVDFYGAEFDHALIERSFVWRSSPAECRAAQVITPRFEEAIGVAYGAHTATGERLDPATPEAVTQLIEEAIGNLENLEDKDRANRRLDLEGRLGADAKPADVDAMRKAWTDCAQNSVVHKDKFNSERVAYFLKMFCEAEPEDLPAVEGFYNNWLGVFRWPGRDAKFDTVMARGLLGLAGTPCPAGDGLSNETKAELRKMLKP